MPHIWCDGCGNGIVLKSILRTIDGVKWDKDEIVLISGIGCSGRTSGYVDFNTLHTTHGRALTFATGMKLSNPELKIIVLSGDGDATAIGGNHFIHAARRNLDLNLIVLNNNIYGMTGGQVSPTTPHQKITSTTPHGNPDFAFDISDLAKSAGANFVARVPAVMTNKMDRYIQKAFQKEGFAVVETLTPCPTSYGRANTETGETGVEMLQYQKENSISIDKAKQLSRSELQNKIITGIYVDKEDPSYLEHYQQNQDNAN